MKFALFLFPLFQCNAVEKIHTPHRISYQDLLKNDKNTQDTFMKALSEIGLVSITEISSYEESKEKSMNWILHECSQDSDYSKSFEYNDGTVRHTLGKLIVMCISAIFSHYYFKQHTPFQALEGCRKSSTMQMTQMLVSLSLL